MVKIALAGGSGNVGREILDALVARGKHEILILSRKDAPNTDFGQGVKWVQTSYDDVTHLVQVLEGVHTVLSFVAKPADPTNTAPWNTQKNLIDASIKAGVRRFAPSEWGSSKFEHTFWYGYKEETRQYLASINKDKKVLEYCLFQPGLFINYMTYPYSSSKYVKLFETPINYYQRRALVVDGGEDAIITFTTAQDLAKVVALAVEYEGEWPVVGGIQGAQVTVGQLIALGEKIRGGPFDVTKLKADDLQAGVVKAPWLPKFEHPSMPPETVGAIAPSLVSGMLLGFVAGNMVCSDEWNRLLPGFKFTQPEEFLTAAWAEIDAGAKTVFTSY
ncbi:NmrA-like family protein [Colletotrichum orchidophilum]|uniref:NmrA-like family protein n=1 Tax=Colletotrichum orchidophilum TaxID=1209926 RepID=A0A1G4BP02_9PEZI|nr:NmrA-like family protein [Colletotrichum orchidophilum]OHF03033.1 NmrA-like family protein [Colletotrichum orchidophilum]